MFSEIFAGTPVSPNLQWEAKLSQEAAGRAILDLTVSNPTAANIPYPQGIPALLDRPEAMRYRPDPRGRPETRAAVAEYHGERGRSMASTDLILTASTSEAYSFLFKLLCNPGDEVLIPSPTYPLFDALAELEHVKPIRYPLRFDSRWQADFGFLRSIISTRCKALILVNPNNPTGQLADAGEIRAYLELAAEYDLALIVDEVFCAYPLGDRPFLPIESAGPLVFTLNGLSKTLGLPQLKLGWIHVAGAREAVNAALAHLEWIADAFLSVNTPVQAATGDLLRLAPAIQSAILARLRANLDTAEAMTLALDRVRLLKPEAGWYLVLDLDLPLDDETLARDLVVSHQVYVYPGHLFGFESGCRLVASLLGEEAAFTEGLGRILACASAAEAATTEKGAKGARTAGSGNPTQSTEAPEPLKAVDA